MPQVSIIIATYDRPESLRETLDSLEKEVRGFECGSHGERGEVEVLVVVNGPAAASRAVAEEFTAKNPCFKAIVVAEQGKSVAINHAIGIAEGEVLVFSDDDLRFEPGWLWAMSSRIRSGLCDVAVGQVMLPPDRQRDWMDNLHMTYLATTVDFSEGREVNLVGASSAVHRKVFDLVPYFDPELGPPGLGAYEDTLISHQIHFAGFRLAYAKDAVVWHHFDLERLTRAAFLRRSYAQGRSHAYVRHHWWHDDEHLVPEAKSFEAFRDEAERIRSTGGLETPPTVEELKLVQALGHWDQYAMERERPRNYRLRGFQKIRGVLPHR